MSVKIKLCGLFRPCDADYVNTAAPDYAGFVFYPLSHRAVTPDQAAALRAAIVPSIQTVGVFVNAELSLIGELVRKDVISVVQLHGDEDEAYIAALRKTLPDTPIWKAFRIRTVKDLSEAGASSADCILLDSGMGSGKAFDWSLLKEVKRPYILAGGLTPETISEALAHLSPIAVDLSSGVETDKVKDPEKMKAAVRAVREFGL